MDQVRPKYGSGVPKIWIRCAQNSLKKLEGAEVSMQLRGLHPPKHFRYPWWVGYKTVDPCYIDWTCMPKVYYMTRMAGRYICRSYPTSLFQWSESLSDVTVSKLVSLSQSPFKSMEIQDE
jgi:hypothetical protein